MLEYLNNYLKNKKVLIFGYGREGKSTFNTIKDMNCDITIGDENTINNVEGYKTISNFNQDDLNNYDIVFKSPGIVLKKDIKELSCVITSQTNIFLSVYRDQIIGITASKGKSTTTSLMHHILRENGFKSLIAGNIGIPMFELISEIDKDTKIVLELSCHQMEYATVSPHISILLNLYEEHLDHYGTKEKYWAAKQNIYNYQTNNDYLIINPVNKPLNYKGHLYLIDPSILPFNKIEDVSNLRGEHNKFNIAAIYLVCKLFNINDEQFINSLKTFIPLEHRLEYVGKYNDIDYYNDSISTICESCIQALESINNIETILIGGMDRGIDYTPLINYLNNHHIGNIVLMYESGLRIKDKLNNTNNIVYFNDLYKAFEYSKNNTSKGKAIVLSPAAASYGYFKNFEERGTIFKQLVKGDYHG